MMDDAWAISVDIAVAGMIFWVLSGLWLWWELKATRRVGLVCIVGGLGLFGFFLVSI